MNQQPGRLMEAEIAEQIELLPRVAPLYASELKKWYADKSFDIAMIVARGSSDNVALYLRYLIEIHLEIPAVLAAPSVWTKYNKNPKYGNCLAIGISQSGAGPDVSEVLRRMEAAGHSTLAITNNGNSLLAKTTDHSLLLSAGAEKSVAATKTFSTSLLAAYQLVKVLQPGLPDPHLPTKDWFETCRTFAQQHAPIVIDADPIFVTARGLGFACALETSLKLMECSNISAKGYSIADFHHGPKSLAGPGGVIVNLDPGDTSLSGLESQVLNPPVPETTEEMAPLWLVVYGQYLALECSRLKGLDADLPRYLSKVTKTL